jgi:hypothetical protein
MKKHKMSGACSMLERDYKGYKILIGKPKERERHRRVYPKVSGLAAWSENCKWYSSLPLGEVASLFCESV